MFKSFNMKKRKERLFLSKIKIFSLGGLNENGKNMYIVEVDQDIFVFDAGLKNADDNMLGVDYILPNYDYLKEKHFSLSNMKMHNVNIDVDSKLYSLINKEQINVNSIHKCKIDNPGAYTVKGKAEDGIIELLELENKGFNIGVQWHPEFITENEEQNLIFKKFIQYIKEQKKND